MSLFLLLLVQSLLLSSAERSSSVASTKSVSRNGMESSVSTAAYTTVKASTTSSVNFTDDTKTTANTTHTPFKTGGNIIAFWLIPISIASILLIVVSGIATVCFCKRQRRRGRQSKHGTYKSFEKTSTSQHELPAVVIEPPKENNEQVKNNLGDSSPNKVGVNKLNSEKFQNEGTQSNNGEDEEGPYDFDKISCASSRRLSKEGDYDLVDLDKYKLAVPVMDDDEISQSSIISAEADGVYDKLHSAVEKRHRRKKESVYDTANFAKSEPKEAKQNEESSNQRKTCSNLNLTSESQQNLTLSLKRYKTL